MSSSRSRKSSKNLRPPNHSAGIALVSVLWLLLLLSGLAATVAYIARVEALLTRRAFDLARAQAAADAAIVNTIGRLSDEQPNRRPHLGVPLSWQFDGVDTSAAVTLEAGRIDLNLANDELLRAFLENQGIPADAASSLLEELRRWQDLQMAPPASISDTTRGVTNVSPPIRMYPLAAVEELGRLPGWRVQNLNCWMQSLTVYSDRPDVATSDAMPGALAAVHWMHAHSSGETTASLSEAMPGPSPARSVLGEVIRIHTTATVAEVSTSSEWIGRLTGDAGRPTLTIRWDHGSQAEPASCGQAGSASEP